MHLAHKLSIAPQTQTARANRAKPFLKWAGGKTQLLPEILARMPENFGRYHEPFIGGGALFFNVRPNRAVISDINPRLVNTYLMLRDRLFEVMQALKKHHATEEHFYKVRAIDPESLCVVERAARMIFLNRTCFNGLYRVNKSGRFNVPFGKYKNPTICNEDNLPRVSAALQGVDIRVSSAFDVRKRARRGDFVYFDPPYDPVSSSASFTAYAKEGFGRAEQTKLAEVFGALAHRGVHVLLSNSDTPLVRELYADFHIEQVFARRAINSRGGKRGAVAEVLVSPRAF